MKFLYVIGICDTEALHYARMLGAALQSLGGTLEVVCPGGDGIASSDGLVFTAGSLRARLRRQDYHLVFAGNPGLALILKLIVSTPVFMFAQGHQRGLLRRAGVEVIGLDWFHFGHAVLPPLLEAPGEKSQPIYDTCLILPSQPLKHIIRHHSAGTPTVCCHPEVAGIHRQGNLTLLPSAHWLKALSLSRAVLGEGHLRVVAESFNRGIPLRLLGGRSRISCHSRLLVELELATRQVRLSDPLPVCTLQKQERTPRVHYPRVATALMHWFIAGQPVSLVELSRQLWRQVLFAEWADERLHELAIEGDMQCGGLLR